MKGKRMKTFRESVGGLLTGAIVLICAAFLIGLFFKGSVWISVKILPIISSIALIVLVIDFLIILPLGIFGRTREISAVGLVIFSYAYEIYLLCWSMLIAYTIWGAIGLMIGIFIAGAGVVPVAFLAVAFEGEWSTCIHLIVLAVLTYGSRMLGFYLAEKADDFEYERSVKTMLTISNENFE